jgi:HAD superfamily hydrolase (TIGR01509 family)
VEPVLVAAGIHHRFAARVYRESVVRLKPDPEPYRTAAELLSAKRPLVVEDSEPGVESAVAAGFDYLRIRRPRDLPRLLRRRLPAGPPA